VDRVWAGVIGSAVVLAVAAYLTRANQRRFFGALAGGVAAAAVNVAVDVAASASHLWRYPSVSTPYAPLWYYSGALMGVAAIALVIWRVDRRYGSRGVALALAASAVLFPIRDYRVATTTNVIEFGDGLAPWLADGVAAVVVISAAVLVMRVLAGRADSDSLARSQ